MRDFQCAAASTARHEPIFATASQVRRWLLVEVRGSWGRDSITNTNLGRHVTDGWRDRMQTAGIRVIAIRRDLERVAHHSLRLFYVDSGTGPERPRDVWRRDVAGLHAVVHATESLPDPAADGVAWSPHDAPLILVCTNGRHDACCATFGRPVVRALRASAHADAVWECSHIGGDRFAGNIVVLPDGLYFGRCDADAGLAVIDAYRRGHLALDHYRGQSTRSFTHQAAEFFVRRELGLTAIDAVHSVRRTGEPPDGTFEIDLGGSSRAIVTVRRSVAPAPSALTCTGPGDVMLPRYELVDIRTGSSRTP